MVNKKNDITKNKTNIFINIRNLNYATGAECSKKAIKTTEMINDILYYSSDIKKCP